MVPFSAGPRFRAVKTVLSRSRSEHGGLQYSRGPAVVQYSFSAGVHFSALAFSAGPGLRR